MLERKTYKKCYALALAMLKSIGVVDMARDTSHEHAYDPAVRYYTATYFGGLVYIDTTIGNGWIWIHIDHNTSVRYMTLAIDRCTGAFDSLNSTIWLK